MCNAKSLASLCDHSYGEARPRGSLPVCVCQVKYGCGSASPASGCRPSRQPGCKCGLAAEARTVRASHLQLSSSLTSQHWAPLVAEELCRARAAPDAWPGLCSVRGSVPLWRWHRLPLGCLLLVANGCGQLGSPQLCTELEVFNTRPWKGRSWGFGLRLRLPEGSSSAKTSVRPCCGPDDLVTLGSLAVKCRVQLGGDKKPVQLKLGFAGCFI